MCVFTVVFRLLGGGGGGGGSWNERKLVVEGMVYGLCRMDIGLHSLLVDGCSWKLEFIYS